jgi:hypothetical protein
MSDDEEEVLATEPATSPLLALRDSGKKTARKHANLLVRDKYNFTKEPSGKTKAKCKHCDAVVQEAMTVNVTKLESHLQMCQHVSISVKHEVSGTTQRSKKIQKCQDLMPGNGQSLGQQKVPDVLSDMSSPKPAVPAAAPASAPRSGSSMKSFIHTMNATKAAQIQRPEVEAVVARFEPLARFDDPFAPGHAHVPGGGHGRWNCRGALLFRGLAPGPPLREVLRVAHCR